MGALSENQIKQDTDAKMTPVNDTTNAPGQGSIGPGASGDSTQNAWQKPRVNRVRGEGATRDFKC